MSRNAQDRVEKRLQQRLHNALHKFVRSKGGRWRKRLHSPAAEKGASR